MEDKIKEKDFAAIKEFALKYSGMNLKYDKEYHVRQKLTPLLVELKLKSFTDFAEYLENFVPLAVRDKIISSLTINETKFFRDVLPFDTFQSKILPKLVAEIPDRRMRGLNSAASKVAIWSAACSTGQEPYTIAMSISEHINKARPPGVSTRDFAIAATDVDQEALKKAVKGEYNSFNVEGSVPPTLIDKYFRKVGSKYQIDDSIRRAVDFKHSSLLDDSLLRTRYTRFDVIFLRNVLIYFDSVIKQRILGLAHGLLDPNGYLFLGSSENIFGLDTGFEPVFIDKIIVYRRKDRLIR